MLMHLMSEPLGHPLHHHPAAAAELTGSNRCTSKTLTLATMPFMACMRSLPKKIAMMPSTSAPCEALTMVGGQAAAAARTRMAQCKEGPGEERRSHRWVGVGDVSGSGRCVAYVVSPPQGRELAQPPPPLPYTVNVPHVYRMAALYCVILRALLEQSHTVRHTFICTCTALDPHALALPPTCPHAAVPHTYGPRLATMALSRAILLCAVAALAVALAYKGALPGAAREERLPSAKAVERCRCGFVRGWGGA